MGAGDAGVGPGASATGPDERKTGTAEVEVVPVRHLGRIAVALAVAVVAAATIRSVAGNGSFGWGVVGQYLFDPSVLAGLRVTVELTAIAMAIGVAGGVVLAVMRLSKNPLVAGASRLYIWFFRGTPVLLQLIFWFYVSALYPTVSFGVPFGPTFVHGSANVLITKFVAAMLALGLNEAAYMAEIVRAGILAVDEGQVEAAQSLGMTRLLTMRRIVLPQAMRVIIPPTGNEVISMLKTTSIVYVIALADLLYSAQLIYARTYQTIPLLVVAAIWYLAVTSVLYVGQYYLERRFGRGGRQVIEPLWRRIGRGLGRVEHAPVGEPDAHVLGSRH